MKLAISTSGIIGVECSTRHDRLLLNALLDTIFISLQPLIARTTTSLDAWKTLANTYTKPSRGHIKQLNEQLKRCNKGSKSISEYIQAIKNRVDELALLGKPIDDKDLIDRVLEGLSDEYKSVIDSINARDTSISFAELHEKLLNKEASLQIAQPPSLSLPATKNPTAFENHPNWRPHQPPIHNNQALPICFLLMINANPNLIWVVVKHAALKDTLPNDARRFDFSLINNHQHLVLKALRDIAPPYPGNHEPIMLLWVKDLNTGTILLIGEPKDGVYEWPTTSPSVSSPPFLAFSSVKTTSSEWHSRLGHP
ncbi:hypothetical protein F3Y22_tig00000477pilonHSYRG00260 [Hibiscus syriacus]|uniref:Retrovirus-related Pol polyprotein from transposon RE1 n=1 Tax=Hibiscus syriacus TaxID=106335 RepID=A0A6A3CZT5_HIBSY|nr:hypothetical protein F3Y22_tig00000477pilonHSYRG00260 [Hibiscus syriacus]